MTDELTADYLGPLGLFPESQWRIETIQLVNWGGFHQRPATFSFHPDSTIVTGASGVGKSTVLDAYLALIMPSNVPFNGASNAATVGRARSAEQRNLVTYLRGKTDDMVEEGRITDKVLRGQGKPTWGAVAATFVSDSGERFTAARGYFVPAAATRDGDVVKRMITLPGVLDVRDLEPFARFGGDSFPETAMRANWPALRVRQSYEEFAQTLFNHLGIGVGGDGAKALNLLARIQEGAQFGTVDALYKRLVIEKPETFRVADEAIATFNGLDDMYQKMEVSQQQANLLEPITEVREAMAGAQRDIDAATMMGSLRDHDTPAGLWRLRTQVAALEAEEDDLRGRETSKREELASASAAAAEATKNLDDAKADYKVGGGDEETSLAERIDELDRLIQDRRGVRIRLADSMAVLGTELDTEQALLDLHAKARDRRGQSAAERSKLDTLLSSLARDEYPIHHELTEVSKELRSLDGRTSRVEISLDDRRRAAADAADLDLADLPFVAELIDVAKGEEDWRIAIETVLYSSARTMLVPLEHLDSFSHAIEQVPMSPRLVFAGVDRGVRASSTPMDPDRLAGKLDFKDSPYQAWVIDHITNAARNALCVATPADLAGDGLRVTPAGQTRRRRSGAHGRNSSRLIIGFDNADTKADLQRRENELRRKLDGARGEREKVSAELANLTKVDNAYERILDFTWAQIDVESKVREVTEHRQMQKVLMAGDNALTALKNRVDDLTEIHGAALGRRHVLETELKALNSDRGHLAELIDSAKDALEVLEDDPSVTITSNLSMKLGDAWAAVLGDERATRTNWGSLLNRLGQDLDAEAESAREIVDASRKELERIFAQFQERWYDPNRGKSVDSYPDYLSVLEEITRVGIHTQREKWRRSALQWTGKSLRLVGSTMSSAVDEIDDRIDSVNEILHALPFGPTNGRLKIKLNRLAPQPVASFRKELTSFAKLSTAGVSDDELVARFVQMRKFVAQIRDRSDKHLTHDLADLTARDEILDVRRHVEITARQLDESGNPIAEYASLAGKSGGEMQELVAFIVGAALRFQLGDESRSRPRFAPVFLDEGFIKADSEFAGRAVEAWKGLGFQLVVGAPLDKYTGLEPHVGRTLLVTKSQKSGHSFVDLVLHEGDVAVAV